MRFLSVQNNSDMQNNTQMPVHDREPPSRFDLMEITADILS